MGPTQGRIVLYSFTNQTGELVTRPAIVTQVFSGTQSVNLTVFFCGGDQDGLLIGTPTGIPQADEPTSGFWMWPPTVASMVGAAAATATVIPKVVIDSVHRGRTIKKTKASKKSK